MTEREKAFLVIGMLSEYEREAHFIAEKFNLTEELLQEVFQEAKAYAKSVREADRKREAPEIPADAKLCVPSHAAWQFTNVPPDRILDEENHVADLCNMPESCTCQCKSCAFIKEEFNAHPEEKPGSGMDFFEMERKLREDQGSTRPYWPHIPILDDDDDEED